MLCDNIPIVKAIGDLKTSIRDLMETGEAGLAAIEAEINALNTELAGLVDGLTENISLQNLVAALLIAATPEEYLRRLAEIYTLFGDAYADLQSRLAQLGLDQWPPDKEKALQALCDVIANAEIVDGVVKELPQASVLATASPTAEINKLTSSINAARKDYISFIRAQKAAIRNARTTISKAVDSDPVYANKSVGERNSVKASMIKALMSDLSTKQAIISGLSLDQWKSKMGYAPSADKDSIAELTEKLSEYGIDSPNYLYNEIKNAFVSAEGKTFDTYYKDYVDGYGY